MNQVTLNTNSWHFKYYSLIVSDNPPKSLCPYFWTMVLLMLLSPVVGLFFAINYINKQVTNFFDRVLPKKPKKEETYEEIIARWEKKDKEQKKREKFWNKAGDVLVWTLKWIILPTVLLFLIYFTYKHVVKVGWVVFLISLGIGILVSALFIGVIKLIEWITEKVHNNSNRIGKFFSYLNPLNWKATKIVGEMIKAQYTKMCPLITWVGDEKKEDTELA